MAVWAEITYSQALAERRLDSEYYKPVYLALDRLLERQKWQAWGRLGGQFIVGPFGSAFNVENFTQEGPYRYIRGKDVKPFFLQDDDNVYIPADHFLRLSQYALKPGDLLVSVVGTLGNVSIVSPEAVPAVFSCKSTVYRCSGIDPYYLCAYLNCRVGSQYLLRKQRGAVQTGLNLEDLKSIPVPRFSPDLEETIAQMVRDAHRKLGTSKALYTAAQRMLEEELELDKIDLSHHLGYETRLSKIFHARRWDAQHYRPKYDVLLDAIRKAPDHRLLRDIVTYNQRGLQPEYIPEGPVAVVNSQHLGPQHLVYEQFEKTSEDAFASAVRARIRKNDVLVYTTGAYVGRTNVFLEDIWALASNHVNIIRLRPEYDAAYVALVMNSPVGLLQTEKHATGSAQAELYPSAVAKFVIPLLQPRTVAAIGDKVRMSYRVLCEAKELLEQAKRRVEELIEQEVA